MPHNNTGSNHSGPTYSGPSLQTEFARALTNPNYPIPHGVVDPGGNPAPKRFGVYRNNVTVSLIEALQATFPAVSALVGEHFFKELARNYLRAHPPSSPLMINYGDGFADFISANVRLQSMPFVFDVARLERAWLDSYHAADATILDPAAMSQISEEKWAEARFVVHPAALLVPSDHPLVDLWEAGRAGRAAAGVDPNLIQWALITRPTFEVDVIAVSAASGPFLAALMAGKPLKAGVALMADAPNFDLSRVMGRLLQAGAFTNIVFSSSGV